MALEQLDLVRQEGVDPARLTIAHLDRNPDAWLHRKVADSGAFFSFDGITRVKYYPEDVRTRCILDLVRHGHADQVLVGGDIARRTMFASYGEGGLGMGYILEKWVPRFIEEAGELAVHCPYLWDPETAAAAVAAGAGALVLFSWGRAFF
jgi:phosphotriesterase-related protein